MSSSITMSKRKEYFSSTLTLLLFIYLCNFIVNDEMHETENTRISKYILFVYFTHFCIHLIWSPDYASTRHTICRFSRCVSKHGCNELTRHRGSKPLQYLMLSVYTPLPSDYTAFIPGVVKYQEYNRHKACHFICGNTVKDKISQINYPHNQMFLVMQ